MSGRRGRPTKPYRSSDGREVSGLIKLGDGRWRIARLGNTFTEHDERRAVDRATKLLGLASDAVHHVPIASVDPEDCTAFQNARGKVQCATVSEDPEDQNKLLLSQPVAEAALWQWMRDQLIADPVRCAEKTGVADLAKLEFLPLPKKPISLETVLKTYQAHAEVTDQTKKETSNTFTTFIKMTGASTLRELTTEKLTRYRDEIKSKVKSPATIAAYFGRVKWVIAFAKFEGSDIQQIDAVLSRMAVLKAPKDKRPHRPTPISRADWASVYSAAEEWDG